jgi:hypothetical protein
MLGKIETNCCLFVKRGEERIEDAIFPVWKEQRCPWSGNVCGQWCPAFEEQEATHPELIMHASGDYYTREVPLEAGIVLKCFPQPVFFEIDKENT